MVYDIVRVIALVIRSTDCTGCRAYSLIVWWPTKTLAHGGPCAIPVLVTFCQEVTQNTSCMQSNGKTS